MRNGLTSNYQIIVDRVKHTATFEVQVEMTQEMFSDTVRNISAYEGSLIADMKSVLGISPKVTLVAPRSIARSEGKAVRVIDKRKI
jgi:phenylacetate-CoA ligase